MFVLITGESFINSRDACLTIKCITDWILQSSCQMTSIVNRIELYSSKRLPIKWWVDWSLEKQIWVSCLFLKSGDETFHQVKHQENLLSHWPSGARIIKNCEYSLWCGQRDEIYWWDGRSQRIWDNQYKCSFKGILNRNFEGSTEV